MSSADLSIRISSDVTAAVSGINKVEAGLNTIAPAATAAAAGISKLSGPAAQTFDRLALSANKATAAIAKVPNTSSQATQSLVNLSRVAQDAPYGFIGIANNLNPLLESFQRLKASTGSTKGALKSLGQSLTGAGGIGLALGIVSSLLVVFGDKLFGSSKAAKAAEDANKELAKSITDDLVKLTSIVGLIQNVNTSNEDRAKALQAVNDQYAKYIPNLEKEGITAANIAKSYDLITESLLRQAVVKGLQKQIAEQVEKTAGAIIKLQLAEENKRIAVEKANSGAKAEISALDAAAKKQQQYQGTIKDGNIAQQGQRAELTKSIGVINNTETAIASLKKELMAMLAPALNIAQSFGDLGVDLKPGKIDKDLPVEVKKVKFTIKDAASFDFDTAVAANVKMPKKVKFDITGGSDRDQGTISPKVLTEAEAMGEATAAAFNAGISSTITAGLSTLASGLGEALAGGEVESAFAAFGQTIGAGLQAIGEQLIAIGVAAVTAKLALDTLFENPFLAIAAGVALVAAGAAFKSVMSKGLSGRATGGPVSANQPYIVGEVGREIFVPSTSGRIIPNNKLGGLAGAASQMVQVLVTGRIQGRDLVLATERQMKYQGRNV